MKWGIMSSVLNRSANSRWGSAGFLLSIAFTLLHVLPSSVWGYSDSELASVQSEKDNKIHKIRENEIVQLTVTLKRRSPQNRKAELYFRLAELYLEAYRAEFLLEGAAHEKRLKNGQSDTVIDRSNSKKYLKRGIEVCKEILKLQLQFKDLDRVYYFLGFYYDELGESKSSLPYYKALIEKFPGSIFIIEAYRELGKGYYREGQYLEAQKYFTKIIETFSGSPQLTPDIYHKLAWTYYRLRQPEAAIEMLKKAVELSSKNGEKFLSIRNEALRDLALFMTQTGDVESAIRYFTEVIGDKSYFSKALLDLGREFEKSLEPQKAVRVYEVLLKMKPERELAFQVRVKLMDLHLRNDDPAMALNQLKNEEIIATGSMETQAAFHNVKSMIRRTAIDLHEKYRKNNDPNSLHLADEYYSLYLDKCLAQEDSRKETPEIQMYLAEVKAALGKSEDSSYLYKKVMNSGDNRYSKEAGALWVEHLSKVIQDGSHKTTGSKANKPNDLENEFVSAADELFESAPGTFAARESSLRAAQILAAYDSRQVDSSERCKKIISKWPESSQALLAAALLVQVLGDRLPDAQNSDPEEYQEQALKFQNTLAELRSNRILLDNDRSNNRNKLQTSISTQQKRIRAGMIIALEREEKFEKAAQEYEKLANDSTDQPMADNAYSGAVSNYLRVSEYGHASRILDSWRTRFPGSEKNIELSRRTATMLFIDGNFDGAASVFEKLGSSGKDQAALITAAAVSEGAGNIQNSQRAQEEYLRKYPSNTGRWQVALDLARSYEKASNISQAVNIYNYCLKGPAAIRAESGVRLADLYMNLNRVKDAGNLFKWVVMQKDQVASPFIGYSRFRLAEFTENQQHFEPLKPNGKNFKEVIVKRLKMFETLSKDYLIAVESGGPWSIVALHRLAYWTRNFADELDSLGSDTVIAETTRSLRKKAVAAWKQAYLKAQQSEILSPILPTISDELIDLDSSAVKRAQGYKGKFRVSGISLDGGETGKENIISVRKKLLNDPKDAGAWIDYGNLLWGLGKPLLSQVAYERAMALDPHNPGAWNNWGVVLLGGNGEEDWFEVSRGTGMLRKALEIQNDFIPAKFNLAAILNYYRLFTKAVPLWKQIVAVRENADALDGMAISLMGTGETARARQIFEKADQSGVSSRRFASRYHNAVISSVAGRDGAVKCLEYLTDFEREPVGFEKDSVERLRKRCEAWKEKYSH